MPQQKIVATIEARMGSTRLPGKVLLPALGKPMLEHMVDRVRRSVHVQEIVIALPHGAENDPIADLATQMAVYHYRGSEHDVLQRVVGAARSREADLIVQLTGDCPVVDPAVVDTCVERYLEGCWDYVANELVRTYPIGFDIAVVATDVLASTCDEPDLTDADREHVTTYIVDRPDRFRQFNLAAPPFENRPDLQVTLDTPEDYRVLRSVFETLMPRTPHFTTKDVIGLLNERPDLAAINRLIKRKPKKPVGGATKDA